MKKWIIRSMLGILVISMILTYKFYIVTGENSNKDIVHVVLYDTIMYELTPFSISEFSGTVKAKDTKGLLNYIEYKDGKRDGTKTTYYKNGQIRLKAEFKNDLLNGKLIGWNEYGQKLIEVQYKNDKENGEMREWYDNSFPKMHGFYIRGQKHGKFTKWDERGKVIDEETYNYGRKK